MFQYLMTSKEKAFPFCYDSLQGYSGSKQNVGKIYLDFQREKLEVQHRGRKGMDVFFCTVSSYFVSILNVSDGKEN